MRSLFAATLAFTLALSTPISTVDSGGVPEYSASTVAGQIAGPYEELFVDNLRTRTYGEGEFKVEQTLQVTNAFTRSLISFTSDGLKVYGFMNTPRGKGPFPVVLVLHGHVNPKAYRTPFTYTQRYADALARAGFLVIHPDYRGHGKSEGDEVENNLFRTGYAIDVLNLIEHLKRLPNAKPDAIGLFGHSMGGGISIRVLTISQDVRAAVLYGSMSGDERLNVDRIKNVFRGGASYMPEDDVPLELWDRISPINYLDSIQAAIEIHHGEKDDQVPLAWAEDLNQRLTQLGKQVEYFSYPQGGHSLQGRDYTTLMQRVVRFFRARLNR